jgi:hypothetical protein
MHCMFCQRPLPLIAKILNGKFCDAGHRDSYLNDLNRLGLARLVEARSWIHGPPQEARRQCTSPIHRGQRETVDLIRSVLASSRVDTTKAAQIVSALTA